MDTFRGITTADLARLDPARAAVLDTVEMPVVVSWRQMGRVNPFGQALWTAKPQGEWVAVVRYGNGLISTSGDVPLEVEWSKVYEMLREHGAVLYCVLGESGLVAELVQRPGGSKLPLMPGFFAKTTEDAAWLGIAGLEKLSQEGHDWPDNLIEPWVFGLDKLTGVATDDESAVMNKEHRQLYLRQSPYGVWVMLMRHGELGIYEVLS